MQAYAFIVHQSEITVKEYCVFEPLGRPSGGVDGSIRRSIWSSPLISVSMAIVLRLAPQSKPSQERILVVSQTGARRKVFELVAVPAPQDHILDLQSIHELLDYLGHLAPPFFLAQPFEAAQS